MCYDTFKYRNGDYIMKNPIGYYYLHTNGTLIYKPYIDDMQVNDFTESPFCKKYWTMYDNSRMTVWNILIDAAVNGASIQHILDKAEKFKCDNDDALIYADKSDISLSVHKYDLDVWTAEKHGKTGAGLTAIESIIDLKRALLGH